MRFALVGNLVALAVMPIVLVGVINRVKSLWAGRRGPPILQLAYDLVRLARKTPVYSAQTTPVFRIAPLIVLVTAVASACIVPLLGTQPLAAFDFDFVWFAYVWGFGRVAMMLGALDTGSAFEGMGAAREATFAAFLEPVLFLAAGALCLHAGTRSFHAALVPHFTSGAAIVLWVAVIIALAIVVQVETGRMPVDDPTTHLELTMVHEVMTLDHSGPELAAIQLGAAIKLFVGVSVIATLLNPLTGTTSIVLCAVVNLALSVGLAIGIGLVESLVARLKLRVIPLYILVATAAGGVALLALMWRAELPL